MKRIFSLLTTMPVLVACALAQPQQSANFRITKSVLDAGGQPSTSANFRLTSSFGQPAPVGVASSANFALTAGFLSPAFLVSPLSPIQDLVIQSQNPDVLLEWSAVPGAMQYKVYRSLDPTVGPLPGNLIATVSGTTYTDPNVTATNSREFYIVTALNGTESVSRTAHGPGLSTDSGFRAAQDSRIGDKSGRSTTSQKTSANSRK